MDNLALNIGLLFPTKEDVRLMLETTTTDVFDGSGKTFAKDGLYSNTIYDTIGSPNRYITFSYKELGTKIIHPRLYRDLLSLSSLFPKIVESKQFVLFNEKTLEFEESDIDNGYTGYSYFIKHAMKMKLPMTDSDSRKEKIKAIEKFRQREELFIERHYILPAGMREYTIHEDARDEEDEINDYYKSIIRLSNMVINTRASKDDMDIIDPTLVKLQQVVLELYTYIMSLMEGKHKRLRGSWVSRDVDNGSTNVLSSIPITIDDLDDTDSSFGFNETIIGIYQYIMMYPELIRYHLLNKILYKIFNVETNVANLFDIKTLKKKQVELSRKEFTAWTSVDGINSIMYKLSTNTYLNAPVIVSKHYLLLVEDVGADMHVRFDTSDIVEVANVRPITFGELFSIVAVFIKGKVGATMSRYPITTQGSNYLTIPIVYTTKNATKKVIHLPAIGHSETLVVDKFPELGKDYVNTLGVHFSRLSGLGGDSNSLQL